MKIPEIEMEIVDVKPITFEEPGPPLFDSRDESRVVIEASLFLQRNGTIMRVNSPSLFGYGFTKSTINDKLLGKKIVVSIELVNSMDRSGERIIEENKEIHQNQNNYIMGEILNVEEREITNINGENQVLFDTILQGVASCKIGNE